LSPHVTLRARRAAQIAALHAEYRRRQALQPQWSWPAIVVGEVATLGAFVALWWALHAILSP